MAQKRLLLLLASISILAFSCTKDPDPDPVPVQNKRAVLVYMAADNNLYGDAFNNINELESAWKDSYEGKIYVLLNPPKKGTTYAKRQPGYSDATYDETTRLLEIVADSDMKVVASKELKNYGSTANPCLGSFFSQVIADTRSLAQAETYGVVMWSHGSGWLPQEQAAAAGISPNLLTRDDGSPLTRSFTQHPVTNEIVPMSFGSILSYSDRMDVDVLAGALPADITLDFIIFDACYMGCVEVAYELRNKAKYTVMSTCEVLARGIPYDNIVGELMVAQSSLTSGLSSLAQKNYQYFNEMTYEAYRLCSMAVIDNEKLDAVAAAVKNITSNYPKTISDVPRTTIQDFGYGSYRKIFYDLGDFVARTWPGAGAELAQFEQAMEDIIVVKYNCSTILGTYPINTFSGLSAYIMDPSQTYFVGVYKDASRFAWGTDTGLADMPW